MRRMFGTAVILIVPDIKIFPKTALDKLKEFNPLLGVPYHQSNASMGTWLGIERASISQFTSIHTESKGYLSKKTFDAINELVQLVKKMEQDK